MNMKMVCQRSGWCRSRLLLITVLFSIARLSNGVDLGFGEEDYTEMENNGQVTIQVTKLQENTEPIVVNIRALTFDEFNNDPNLVLPAEIAALVGGVDPAELDGSRNDFDNTVQQVTFQPSTGNVDENININLVDDIINEAQEGFVVVIEVAQSGAGDTINFVRNGVALIRINDDDDITLGFDQSMYTAQEATGDFTPGPITIVKESSRVSEQVLTVNLNFVPSGFASATEGDDYSTTQMSVTLNPEDVSVQVNVVIIDDDILEINEEFQAILSIPADPPSGLNPSPTAGTTVIFIIDNEVAIIGFEQASYTFIEGTDTTAEVCFSISSPPIAQIDAEDVFALVMVEVFDDSALEGEDFMRPQNYDPNALLDTNTFRVCRTVDLLNDDLEESTESFIFRLTLNPGEFDSAGAFQNTLPQAEVVILDDDSQDIVIEFDPVVYGPITEGLGQSIIFRIVAIGAVVSDIEVLFNTVDGTAISTEDYVARTDFSVIFSAGDTEQSVEVMLADDTVVEETEEFQATLSLPVGSSGVVLGSATVATATIEDDDTVTVQFNPTTYVVQEGQSVAFMLELIGTALVDTEVEFTTADMSATAPDDYVATTQVVTFAASQTALTVSVPTATDTLTEGDEVFQALLSATSAHVVLANDVATATIQDPTELVLGPSPIINAIEGVSIDIVCGPIGVEPITIEVNGVETSLPFQDSNNQRTFTFGPVNRADQDTTFQCFSGALSSNTATLNAFYPPEYTFMALYEGNEGDPLTITLGLDGNPLPPDTFTWMFNGQPLQLGGNVVTLDETTISFSSLNFNNAGTYSVSATNLAGLGSASFDLVVYTPPTYDIEPSYTVNEGDTFNLSTLNLDANPIPGNGEYSWTFNGQPLLTGQPGIDLGVNSILLDPVSRAQAGVYTIMSMNRAGSGQASFALNINSPPTYTVNDTFTPTEGTPFRIDLGLDANPIPGTGMYEWFFNGQSLTLQQPGVITGVDFIDFGGSIGRESSGNYTVSSFNDAGTGNASFMIDVLYPPIYTISSDTFTVVQGQMFDLELGLEANPFPENATWSFNGQILPMISGIELGVNFIRIQMVTPLDEGSYTVQTSNSVGMDMVSFQLQVEVPVTPTVVMPSPTPSLPMDGTAIVMPTQTPDSNGGMGGDPHFSILLPNGQMLCFSVQGEHDFVFSLISNKIIHMNAKFIKDSRRSEVTWIGSLGVVVRSKAANTTSKIRFEASTKMIHVGDKISLNAPSVKRLTFKNGKLSIAESDPNAKKHRAYPQVEVDLQDVGISFTVRFTKDHLDMVWNKVRKQPKDSHGIIGQFFRERVEIDEIRRLLLLPNMEPVAVMRKPVWHFMERDEPEDQLCWAAMNPGYQGKKLIEGHYLDYLVDDVLSSKFKFKAGRYKKNLEEYLRQ